MKQNKITAMEITFYDENFNSFSVDLEPLQVIAVQKVLGLQFFINESGEICQNEYSPTSLQKIIKLLDEKLSTKK